MNSTISPPGISEVKSLLVVDESLVARPARDTLSCSCSASSLIAIARVGILGEPAGEEPVWRDEQGIALPRQKVLTRCCGKDGLS